VASTCQKECRLTYIPSKERVLEIFTPPQLTESLLILNLKDMLKIGLN
jgi:hypothetical protein